MTLIAVDAEVHVRSPRATNLQVRAMSQPKILDREPSQALTGSQEYKLKRGDTAVDPASNRGWTVWAVDDEHGTIDLKVTQAYAGPWPAALVEDSPVNTKVLAERLCDLGDRVVREDVTGRDAGTALLPRLRPDDGDGRSGPLRGDDEAVTDAAVRLVLSLRGSCLPIQGPPGTGKTFTAAGQILELIKAGRTAGIIGPSHAVIHNLLGQVVSRADELGVACPRIGQRADQDTSYLHPGAAGLGHGALETGLRDGDLDIAAGTAWVWACEQFQGSVDTLFVDEAGQMSLANILAVAGAARNLVLIGDPQQLAQPSQAAHPPGAGVSALEHILGKGSFTSTRRPELPQAGRDDLPHLLLRLCHAGSCRYPARARTLTSISARRRPAGSWPRPAWWWIRPAEPASPVTSTSGQITTPRGAWCRAVSTPPPSNPPPASAPAWRYGTAGSSRSVCTMRPISCARPPRAAPRLSPNPCSRAVSSNYGLSPLPTSAAGRSHAASSGCRTSRFPAPAQTDKLPPPGGGIPGSGAFSVQAAAGTPLHWSSRWCGHQSDLSEVRQKVLA